MRKLNKLPRPLSCKGHLGDSAFSHPTQYPMTNAPPDHRDIHCILARGMFWQGPASACHASQAVRGVTAEAMEPKRVSNARTAWNEMRPTLERARKNAIW